ncbi:MAG TPA: TerC family protein [Phycisphaerales bacterium]|nr:TerC family protein [Phycisphaerales bacterium]
MDVSWQGWVLFNGAVLFMLLLDLGVFHRKSERVSVRAALGWTAFWVILSLGFNGWVWNHFGHEKGLEFLAGYILEKSLSVDNLFVFLLIFNYFKVPPEVQHRVLFFGILGALVLRGVFIYLGATLVHQFHWILYLFGAFLVFSGIKLLLLDDDDEQDPENAVVKAFRARLRLTDRFHGDKFWVRKEGVLYATPLFLVLIAVETSDVLFAVDSIPAIFGVTDDTFIVYTSNVMAILGLRALYFALAGLLEYFHYLNYGLALVLIFIGAKMLGENYIELSIATELGVIAALLASAILASILFPKKIEPEEEAGADA